MASFEPNFGRVVPVGVALNALDGWRFRLVGTSSEHLHQGLDIPLAQGTAILTAGDGVVSQVAPTDSSDAGIFVAVSHPNGMTSRYLHLSQALVSVGQFVKRGQQIGRSGTTGLSEGPHLHFDLFASDAALPLVISAVGRPSTGFGFRTSFSGVPSQAIPAEPWLPVDSYGATVVASARALGIPLFRDRPKILASVIEPSDGSAAKSFAMGALAIGGLVGLGYLAWRMARSAAGAPGLGNNFGITNIDIERVARDIEEQGGAESVSAAKEIRKQMTPYRRLGVRVKERGFSFQKSSLNAFAQMCMPHTETRAGAERPAFCELRNLHKLTDGSVLASIRSEPYGHRDPGRSWLIHFDDVEQYKRFSEGGAIVDYRQYRMPSSQRRKGRREPTLGRFAGANPKDVLEIAADAFQTGDVKRGEQILEELPEKDRTIARCTRATKKRYQKGNTWKGWEQVSHYRLYKPLVADPLIGSKPKQHSYTEVTVNASRTTNLPDNSITHWISVLGDLGPTENYPEGEYRFLVSGQQTTASHSQALRDLGYNVIVPCNNVPLSGTSPPKRRK